MSKLVINKNYAIVTQNSDDCYFTVYFGNQYVTKTKSLNTIDICQGALRLLQTLYSKLPFEINAQSTLNRNDNYIYLDNALIYQGAGVIDTDEVYKAIDTIKSYLQEGRE